MRKKKEIRSSALSRGERETGCQGQKLSTLRFPYFTGVVSCFLLPSIPHTIKAKKGCFSLSTLSTLKISTHRSYSGTKKKSGSRVFFPNLFGRQSKIIISLHLLSYLERQRNERGGGEKRERRNLLLPSPNKFQNISPPPYPLP